MLIHTSSLASWILLNIDCERKEYSDLKSKLLDGIDEDEIASKEMLTQINSAFKNAIRDNLPHEDDEDEEEEEEKPKVKTLKK